MFLFWSPPPSWPSSFSFLLISNTLLLLLRLFEAATPWVVFVACQHGVCKDKWTEHGSRTCRKNYIFKLIIRTRLKKRSVQPLKFCRNSNFLLAFYQVVYKLSSKLSSFKLLPPSLVVFHVQVTRLYQPAPCCLKAQNASSSPAAKYFARLPPALRGFLTACHTSDVIN